MQHNLHIDESLLAERVAQIIADAGLLRGDYPQVIRTQKAAARAGISVAQYYAAAADGHYPKPFKLVPGGRASGVLLSDLDAAIRAQAGGGK